MATSRSLGGTPVMSRSPIQIEPWSTSSRPASMRSEVDFPQPDGPTRTRNSPSAMSRLRRSTAGRSEPGKSLAALSNLTVVMTLLLSPAARARHAFGRSRLSKGATSAVHGSGVGIWDQALGEVSVGDPNAASSDRLLVYGRDLVVGQRRSGKGVQVGVELFDRGRADDRRGHPAVTQGPLKRELGKFLSALLGDLVE